MNLNIGMIGTGNIGLTHLLSLKNIEEKNLLSDYNVKLNIRGVADINETVLNNMKIRNPYNIEYFTTNPNDLIKNKSIDIIYITTPTRFHKEYFIKAAESGKNIFCEKPLAFLLEDIKEMISIEKKQKIFTQVGLVLRHCPTMWKLKQILLENKESFGKRLSFISRSTQRWPVEWRNFRSDWRKDPTLAHAGCLFEHSIHDVDILEYFFRDNFKLLNLFAKVRFVSALSQNQIEDVANLNFEYEDGFTGNLTSIWNKTKMDARLIEIFFENGYLLLEGFSDMYFRKFEYLIERKRTKLNAEEIIQEYQKVKNLPLVYPNTGHFMFEDLNFLKSIIEEKKPYPGLEIGYRAHEIIEMAYKSSKENKIISLKS
ncbi:MAG: Gfo/Idh/MocA family protein [Candidatus Heimdallarchaeota archaeon]